MFVLSGSSAETGPAHLGGRVCTAGKVHGQCVRAGLRTADCIAAGLAGWMERRRSGTGLWAMNEAHTHSLQDLEFGQSFLTQKSEIKSQFYGIPS